LEIKYVTSLGKKGKKVSWCRTKGQGQGRLEIKYITSLKKKGKKSIGVRPERQLFRYI
jgi:hypothetical protein